MANVIEHTDMRVIQTGNRFGFALEALLENWIMGKLRRQNLDGHSSIESRVASAKHFAHAPGAERGDDLIRTKLVSS